MSEIISSTLEDYLLTIYRLEKQKRVARSRDIKNMQLVAKSTVTAALQSLAEKELINYEPYEAATLTETGRKIAEKLHLRNMVLREFLEKILALDKEIAASAAHTMEHALNPAVLERFICFMAFNQANQVNSDAWRENFDNFLQPSGKGGYCKKCVDKYLESLREKLSQDNFY
ncbi:MAG: metal-dependent transcriptional regulator [Candidatus Riflebacteria bacterium]